MMAQVGQSVPDMDVLVAPVRTSGIRIRRFTPFGQEFQINATSVPRSGVLILGVGNILLQDEGLGISALDLLCRQYHLPPEVRCVDGGVMGLDLLPVIENSTQLLILDAVECNQAPGTLVRLEGDALYRALAHKLSIHQLGLQDVLATSQLQGTAPDKVVLWGAQPAALEWGVYLTKPVSQNLPALVASAVNELRGWGVDVRPRFNNDASSDHQVSWTRQVHIL